VFVLAPLVFARKFLDEKALYASLGAFGLFCLASSSVYLLNDLLDRKRDRLHPRKRNRPIAAGTVPPAIVVAAALMTAGAALAGASFLGGRFASVLAGYLLLNLAYSIRLKQVVILDVMIIAAGFVLRTWAGSVAVAVGMSEWLILCTALIALFLGFVKRRQELVSAEEAGTGIRASLDHYSRGFLDQGISAVTASTLIAYSLYAFSPETAAKLHTPYMAWTLLPVIYGLCRYLYLVYSRGKGESPARLVLRDRPLLGTLLAWGALVLALLARS